MKTIAFFNNKGGVGKTTLVYHLAWMFADLGIRVVAADFDPQANLTAISLPLDALIAIEEDHLASIYDVVAPVISGDPPVEPQVYEVTDGFGLLPGDLELSFLEDALSTAWMEALNDSPLMRDRGLRGSAVLAKAIRDAGVSYAADIALIDMAPNVGAISRAALLAADYIIIPVVPDVVSVLGLANIGKMLRSLHSGWNERVSSDPTIGYGEVIGEMVPLGYVISRVTTYHGELPRHLNRSVNRLPETFHRDVLNEQVPGPISVKEDAALLAWIRDYRSLMGMAHQSHKPIFHLKPADGAIGGHQQAVAVAYHEFHNLAITIGRLAGIQGL